MTRILLDLRHDTVDGTATARGTLTARRSRIRRNGAAITYPGDLKFTLPGDVILEQPQPGEAWILELYVAGEPVAIYRTVTFYGTEVTWSDLTDVDPATLTPLPEKEALAAWEAVRDQLDTVLSGIAIGPAGPQGEPGQDGRDGRDGSDGPRGLQGVPGDSGAPGRDGQQGNPGQDGAPGARGAVGPAGITWRGTWDPARNYVDSDAVYYDDGAGNAGSWFAATDPPTGDVPRQASAYWVPLAVRGPQGLPGKDGKDGTQGVQGDSGQRGADGAQGVPGNPGAAGVDGKSVTSASATGLAAGASPTAVLTNGALALGIPAGAPGAPGTNGTNGTNGAAGAAGPGVPAGGTARQILRKRTATDYDTEWVDPGYGTTFADASSTASQTISTAFKQITLPTENSDVGNNFDPATSFYTVPADGVYAILAKVRLGDGTSSANGAGINIGIGVNGASVDGPWFVWNAMPAMGDGYRMVFDYQRTARFTAGTQLRLYGYAQTTVGLTTASLTVIRVG